MVKLNLVLLVLVILSVTFSINAANYFVSQSGGGKLPCTSVSTPCSLSTFLNAARSINFQAGDAVRLSAGAYSGSRGPVSITNLNGNSPSNPLVFVGYSNSVFSGIDISSSSNLRFEGLSVRGSNSHGIRVLDSSSISFKSIKVEKSSLTGIYAQRSPKLSIVSSSISDSEEQCIKSIRDPEGPSNHEYSGNIVQYQQGVLIQDNNLQNCGTDGILITTMDAVVRGNKIHRTGIKSVDPPVHGIYCKADNALVEFNVIDDCTHNGITVRNTAVVRNNVVWNIGNKRFSYQTQNVGSCYIFYNDGPQNGGLVAIENNLCYGTGPQADSGITIRGTTTMARGYSFVIQNNTIVFPTSPIIIEDTSAAKSVLIQNNILATKDKTGLKLVKKYSTGTVVKEVNNFPVLQLPNTSLQTVNTVVIPAAKNFKRTASPKIVWTFGKHSADIVN